MEYTRKRKCRVHVDTRDVQHIYPHDLQLYDVPPRGEIPLVELQELCTGRLNLLRHVENHVMRTDFGTIEERKQSLSKVLAKNDLKYFAHLLFGKGCKSSTEMDLECRRKDHISHFILRLTYCFDLDNQMWYINQEIEFFKLRFSSLDKEGIEKLLNIYKVDCQQLTPEEKDEIREELRSSTAKHINVDLTEFYKVPFIKVADLIKTRKVYVSGGLAYVPQPELVSLFVTYLRKTIMDGMPDARMNVSDAYDDHRLSFLSILRESFANEKTVAWSTTSTPIDKLDELSTTSYPLCMRILHEALRTNHHLKHGGRLQYGLFIKGIGVSLEDAMYFWKSEFTKKIDSVKFDKEYAYHIRHSYGQEGRRVSYTPFECVKIINNMPSAGDYHGCPYRYMDYTSLKQKLFDCGLPPTSVNEIAELSKEGHYKAACETYFKVVHNRPPSKVINHPNSYFMESRAILVKDNPTETESKKNLSQSARLNESTATPKRIDRSIGTPLSNAVTPSRSIERSSTLSQKTERIGMTPTRAAKSTPRRIDGLHDLTADEIAEFITQDM